MTNPTYYAVDVEVERRELRPKTRKALAAAIDDLAPHIRPNVDYSPHGWVHVWLITPADSCRDAAAIVERAIETATDRHGRIPVVSVTAMTQTEYCRRPDLRGAHVIGSAEAADILGVSRQRIPQMVQEGKLRGVKIGKRAFSFDRNDVERLAAER